MGPTRVVLGDHVCAVEEIRAEIVRVEAVGVASGKARDCDVRV